MNRARFLISSFAAVLLMLGGASAQNAYVANLGSNTVSVIDTSTNTVGATLTPAALFCQCQDPSYDEH